MSENTENTEKTETKEVKETVEVTSTNNRSWMTKIWSAVVGAAVGVASMFGITQSEITAEKAKVESVKSQAKAAYEALKAGDITTATANLQAVIATGKEIIVDAKVVAEKVKEADKESIVETAKEQVAKTIVADQVKKVETASAIYAADTAKTDKVKTEKITNTTNKVEVKAEVKNTSK